MRDGKIDRYDTERRYLRKNGATVWTHSSISPERMPPLVGITNAPLLRSDGSLLDTPGYDVRTGILYRPDGVVFPRIPDFPTRDDALRAVERLQELISTFPFGADADRSVALFAMLSAIDRRAVEAAPMHTFSAPVAGTGKSKLVDICAIEGLNPDLWAEDDYAIVDPDINKPVGRIYPEIIRASRSGCGFSRPSLRRRRTVARPIALRRPRQRLFKRRYQEVKCRT